MQTDTNNQLVCYDLVFNEKRILCTYKIHSIQDGSLIDSRYIYDDMNISKELNKKEFIDMLLKALTDSFQRALHR